MDRDSQIAKALRYVGSDGCHIEAGAFQFDLLRSHGVAQESRVLEIGAGCLVTGHRLIAYLNVGNYTAIEPNAWLVEAGRGFFGVERPFTHSTATDFDARNGTFDFIHSHSVLSHAGRRQLPEYMEAIKRQLRPGGIALASIRFNASPDGRLYHPGDSERDEWDYPTIQWFTRETVERVSAECGLVATERHDIREAFTAATNGIHHHDWIELRHREST